MLLPRLFVSSAVMIVLATGCSNGGGAPKVPDQASQNAAAGQPNADASAGTQDPNSPTTEQPTAGAEKPNSNPENGGNPEQPEPAKPSEIDQIMTTLTSSPISAAALFKEVSTLDDTKIAKINPKNPSANDAGAVLLSGLLDLVQSQRLETTDEALRTKGMTKLTAVIKDQNPLTQKISLPSTTEKQEYLLGNLKNEINTIMADQNKPDKPAAIIGLESVKALFPQEVVLSQQATLFQEIQKAVSEIVSACTSKDAHFDTFRNLKIDQLDAFKKTIKETTPLLKGTTEEFIKYEILAALQSKLKDSKPLVLSEQTKNRLENTTEILDFGNGLQVGSSDTKNPNYGFKNLKSTLEGTTFVNYNNETITAKAVLKSLSVYKRLDLTPTKTGSNLPSLRLYRYSTSNNSFDIEAFNGSEFYTKSGTGGLDQDLKVQSCKVQYKDDKKCIPLSNYQDGKFRVTYDVNSGIYTVQLFKNGNDTNPNPVTLKTIATKPATTPSP